MNRLSQIFAQQLPLLTARPGSPHATGGAHAAPTVAEAMPSGHSAPMAVVSLLDETIAGPSSNSPNTPAPPGIEVDHRLAQLPTPPPPRYLTGLLPAAADLPPPLPPERQLDSKYTPLLHDFGGLASGALYAMANGGGAMAAAKLAIPLLKDVQKLVSSDKPEDLARSPLGHLLTKEVSPTTPPATHDDLRRALLGR